MTTPEIDWTERKKAERLQDFFDGKAPERDTGEISIGVADEERCERESAWLDDALDAVVAELDDEGGEATPAPVDMAEVEAALEAAVAKPVNDDEATPAAAAEAVEIAATATPAAETTPAPTITAPTPAPDDEPDFERIDHAPILTRFDRARERLEIAEILRFGAEPGSAEFHEAMAELAEAKRALKNEVKRDGTDIGRKQNQVDLWRAGEGRDEYNAGRRKTRSKPNTRLKDMTPEQRAQHNLDMNAKRQWTSKKRKAGWTDARIEAELPGWWEQRLARRG